jgi:hypothetical protein
MKLNFWQWIGLVVLVIALIAIIWRETRPASSPTPAKPAVPSDVPTATAPAAP